MATYLIVDSDSAVAEVGEHRMTEGIEVELGEWATVTGDGTGEALPPIIEGSTEIRVSGGWVYDARFDAETDSDGKPWDD